MHETRAARHRGSRGQSFVEFALILPILLTLFGGAVDVARVYQAWNALEGATRDAAEYAATKDTTSSAALTDATTVVCTETRTVAGFVAPAGTPTNCSSPAVSIVTFSTDTSAASGASATYPIVTVTVRATLDFRTMFAYPLFTQNGAWTLTATETYTIQQNRP
jgi:Flp pilus assembly protein TadG